MAQFSGGRSPVPKIDFDNTNEKTIHDNITQLTRQRIDSQVSLFTAFGRNHERLERHIIALDREIVAEFNKLWRVGEYIDDLKLPGE